MYTSYILCVHMNITHEERKHNGNMSMTVGHHKLPCRNECNIKCAFMRLWRKFGGSKPYFTDTLPLVAWRPPGRFDIQVGHVIVMWCRALCSINGLLSSLSCTLYTVCIIAYWTLLNYNWSEDLLYDWCWYIAMHNLNHDHQSPNWNWLDVKGVFVL